MNKIATLLLGLCLASTSHAATTLDKSSASHFINDFYKAMKAHDARALDVMVADNAKIQLQLIKMQQTFSLSKTDYLQQIKASWYFAKKEYFDLSNINYSADHGDTAGSLTLKMTESKEILNEQISADNDITVNLAVVDDMIKIVGLKAKSTF